jgi:hypothetical protein
MLPSFQYPNCERFVGVCPFFTFIFPCQFVYPHVTYLEFACKVDDLFWSVLELLPPPPSVSLKLENEIP